MSLMEVLVSAFILSILSVSLIHGLTVLELESRTAKDRMASALLAVDLREEILSKSTTDPNDPLRMGIERGDSGPGRMAFDDQDDYQDLVDRPAADITGAPLPNVGDLWRTVRIESVSPADPAGPAVDTHPLGLRRFTVSVYKDHSELTHLTWLSTGQIR